MSISSLFVKLAVFAAAASVALQILGIHAPSALSAAVASARIGADGLFGAGLLLQEAVSSPPPGSYIPLGYWNSLQLKFMYLSRYFFRDNFIFEDWMNDVHISILRDFEARGLAMDQSNDADIPSFGVGTVDFDNLYRDYLSRGKPVVLRNVGVSAMDWSYSSLKERFGDYEMLLHCRNGSDMGCPLGRLDEALRSAACFADGGNGDLFDTYPDLVEEIEVHKFSLMMSGASTPAGQKPAAFVSADIALSLSARAGAGFHSVGHNNLFYMIRGTSRWTFVDPSNTFLMYPFFDATFQRVHSWLTWEATHAQNATDIIRQFFPLYRYAPKVVVELSAGDVLLNPPWHWHMVEYAGPESIGVATRWREQSSLLSPLQYSNALFSFLQFASVDFFAETYRHLAPARYSPESLSGSSNGLRRNNLDNVLNFGRLESVFKKSDFVSNLVDTDQWSEYIGGIVIKSTSSADGDR